MNWVKFPDCRKCNPVGKVIYLEPIPYWVKKRLESKSYKINLDKELR